MASAKVGGAVAEHGSVTVPNRGPPSLRATQELAPASPAALLWPHARQSAFSSPAASLQLRHPEAGTAAEAGELGRAAEEALNNGAWGAPGGELQGFSAHISAAAFEGLPQGEDQNNELPAESAGVAHQQQQGWMTRMRAFVPHTWVGSLAASPAAEATASQPAASAYSILTCDAAPLMSEEQLQPSYGAAYTSATASEWTVAAEMGAGALHLGAQPASADSQCSPALIPGLLVAHEQELKWQIDRHWQQQQSGALVGQPPLQAFFPPEQSFRQMDSATEVHQRKSLEPEVRGSSSGNDSFVSSGTVFQVATAAAAGAAAWPVAHYEAPPPQLPTAPLATQGAPSLYDLTILLVESVGHHSILVR